MLDIITGLSKERGITALISSQLLHQVQRICQRVGIMSKGRLVATGLCEQLAGSAMPKFVFLMLYTASGDLFSLTQFIALLRPLDRADPGLRRHQPGAQQRHPEQAGLPAHL